MSTAPHPDRAARALLGLAAVAVSFAAADTYVVVLALPDMMAGVGVSADQLQRGAPIVSGFLLGYVAVLPLVGRLADLRGRLPVLVGSLVLFALGSLVTAAAYDLPSMVTGRFLQGVGGGGLVPATLALVADLYPVHRRGVPLGVVGAVQELGSVLGPLYGAVVLLLGGWRDIFWLNLAGGLVLAGLLRSRAAPTSGEGRRGGADLLGAALAAGALGSVTLVMLEPGPLTSDVTLGLAFLPVVGDSRWWSPLGMASVALAAAFVARCLLARRPLLDLTSWRVAARRIDTLGALLLSIALGGVVLAFATADPKVAVLSPAGPALLGVAGLAAVGFWWRSRTSREPLVPAGALHARAAWGSLLVSFFVGAALIAALVDIPVFARVSVYNDSQLLAALVLVRFLVALPVGAVVGGWLVHRVPAGWLVLAGMALAGGSFVQMSTWGLTSLESGWANLPLLLAGLGFGLAIAPVNAELLAATRLEVHGLASALLVVARMVGMLVGISALTAIGLRRYYAAQAGLPAPMQVCGRGVSRCEAFSRILQEAGLTQLHTIFLGAAVCAAVAGLVALAAFGRRSTTLAASA